MTGLELEQAVIDADFATWGKSGTYMPLGGGTAVPCTVIIDSPDEVIDLPQGRPVIATAALEVRKSEVAAPAKDGVFTVTEGAVVYKVLDKPQAKDAERLVWTMSVR